MSATLSAIFKAQDNVSRALSNMDKQGNVVMGTFKKLAGVMSGVFAGYKVAEFAKDSTQAFVDFENGMNEVFTLLPDITEQAMGEMTAQVKQFSKAAGVLPEKTVPALYQALSAGVPNDNVFAFLETANKAAVGGVTQLETAVDGLSSVVNAYGADVIDVNKTSDLMFTTVRLGKTNFEQLSQSLFNVLPSASAAGVKFEDVSASLAALTAQGVPTSVATTRVRAAIDELSKAGTKTDQVFREVAGKSFKDFIAQGGNLQQALQLLEKEAKRNNLGINDLFSSIEAGGAALALTGKGTETFTKAMEEMSKATGATDAAFDKMEKGLKRKIDKMKANFEVFKLEVGGRLAGAFNIAFDAGTKFIGFLNSKFGATLNKVSSKLKSFSDLASELGSSFVEGVKEAFSGGDIMSIFDRTFGSVEKLLKAVFGEKAGGTISSWVAKVISIIEKLQPTFTSIRNWVIDAIPTVQFIFEDVFGTVGKVVQDAYDIFTDTLLPVIDSIRKKIDENMPAIRQVTQEAFDKITDVVEFASGKIKDFTNWVSEWLPLEPIIIGIGATFAAWKVGSIVYDATRAVVLFGIELVKLPGKLIAATVAQWNLVTAKIADKVETLAIIGLYAKDFVVALWNTVSAIGAQTAAWIANKVQVAAQAVGLLALKAAQIVNTGITWAMTAAQWALNAAFIASPIGWVVLSIGALIAAGVLLYKNWDVIKAKAVELWNKLMEVFRPIVDYIKNTFITAFEGLKTVFNGIIQFITGVFTGNWQKAWEGVRNIFSGIFQYLGAIFKTPINAVITLINKAIQGINKLDIKIPDWVPLLGGKGFEINIPEIPMLAKGSIDAPDMFIAGEKGPELIVGAAGSTVFPERETNKILEGLSRPVNVAVPKSEVLNPIEQQESTIVEEKHITLDINGSGELRFDIAASKESILELLLEYLKPILMKILKEEIFEEGEMSYEF
jgi:TP901 family phage tail tape measure protein